MNLINISLPYPVLGISDDIYPLLKEDCIQMTPSKTATSFCFDILLKQENEDISLLIKKRRAEYVCEVNCPKTFYRKCFASPSPQIHIEVPKQLICREVSFTCLIIAKTNIDNYSNKDFHPDYQGYSFDIGIGDILAVFGKATYNIDIAYDKLQTAGAFMQIRQDMGGNEFVSFNVASDKIEILLPTYLYKLYENKLGRDLDFSEIFHASLVLNALAYALQYWEDYPDTLWARTLKYRIETEKELQKYNLTDGTEIIKFAQTLLGNPYKRLFDKLCRINKSEEEEEI